MSQIILWHLEQKGGVICCQLIFWGAAEQWDMKSKGKGKVAVKKSSAMGMGIRGSTEWQSGAKGVQVKRKEHCGDGGESDKCDKVMIWKQVPALGGN